MNSCQCGHAESEHSDRGLRPCQWRNLIGRPSVKYRCGCVIFLPCPEPGTTTFGERVRILARAVLHGLGVK